MTEKEKALVPAGERKPINIDMSRGIAPQSYDELMQFASLYKASGLAPDSFKETAQLAVAMAMCLEIGRPVIVGLQDMAVINGTVTIYGDAALAMVRASKLLEEFKEWSEGDPFTDSWHFFCKLKRKGYDAVVGEWTWKESKAAGFDDPKRRDGSKDNFSPWRRFTRRMMQFKARNWVLRDQFGDVLKGMKLEQDVQDAIVLEPGTDGTFETTRTDEEKADTVTAALEKSKPEKEATEPDKEQKEEVARDEALREELKPKEDGQVEDNLIPCKGPCGQEYHKDALVSGYCASCYQGKAEGSKPEKDPILCPHCEHKPFKTPAALKVHITKVHPEHSPKSEESRHNPLTDGPAGEAKEDGAPEGQRRQAPEICQKCTAEACGAAFNRVYNNADNAITCDSYKEAQKEEGETTGDNNGDWVICQELKSRPKKNAREYCPKCIKAETCEVFAAWQKANNPL